MVRESSSPPRAAALSEVVFGFIAGLFLMVKDVVARGKIQIGNAAQRQSHASNGAIARLGR
jgi:hypothetical protein